MAPLGAVPLVAASLLLLALRALLAEPQLSADPRRHTPRPEDDASAATFAERAVEAPRLAGAPLLVASAVLRQPLVNELLRSKVKHDNHFIEVTRLATKLDDYYEPMSLPLWIPTPAEREEHERLRREWLAESRGGDVDPDADLSRAIEARVGEHGFRYVTSADYVRAYRTREKEYSVSRVIKALMSHVVRVNQELGTPVSQFDLDDVYRQARDSADRYAYNKTLGPLDGVPFFVKEELRVKGLQHRRGTKFLGPLHGPAPDDDAPVARLRAAGAIVLGTTSMHELGVGVTGNNPATATPRNPHNLTHYPGGSSSGSAVAVAANFVPFAVSTDGGGSVRIPAALCGMAGLKPTYQRVGKRPYLSVGSVGTIGASVRDVAVSYMALAGPETRRAGSKPGDDPARRAPHGSEHQPPAHLHGVFSGEPASRVRGLRVGYLPTFAKLASASVSAAHDAALAALQAAGAVTVDLEPLPFLDVVLQAHVLIILSEFVALSDAWWGSHAHELNPETVGSFTLGRSVTARELLHAQKIRAWIMDVFKTRVFSKCDVVLLPGAGMPSPRILPDALTGAGESDLGTTRNVMRYMVFANIMGLPAGVVPVGFTSGSSPSSSSPGSAPGSNAEETVDGLPIAVQFMADHWNEHVVLRAMSFLEHDAVVVRGAWPRKPQLVRGGKGVPSIP